MEESREWEGIILGGNEGAHLEGIFLSAPSVRERKGGGEKGERRREGGRYVRKELKEVERQEAGIKMERWREERKKIVLYNTDRQTDT